MIDTHVHFWDTDRHTYDWLADSTTLAAHYGLDDYRTATADDPPSAFVFVQAGCRDEDGAAEAHWVADLCAGADDLAGMVVWVPVDDGAAAVEAHLDALALSKVVGGRRLIQGEAPGLCTRPGFVEGVAALGRRGLSFDVCILAHQLADALTLARRVPATRLVLDHLAKPPIASGELAAWPSALAELAACDNVWCKLSGLVTEADAESWTVDDLRPVVDQALDTFGPGRMLWGSDWPVVTEAASHRRWREATDQLLAELSESEQRAIRSETAIDVYQLTGERS